MVEELLFFGDDMFSGAKLVFKRCRLYKTGIIYRDYN